MRASGGSRIEWHDIPAEVRADVEAVLGARVLRASNEHGGFSPGLAARCLLDDGRRLFLKAVSPDQNPHSARIHRREIEVASQLPPDLPAARLRHVHDDGHWVVLALDEIPGRQPSEPWTLDELDVVVPAIQRLAEAATPTPVPSLQTVVDRQSQNFRGWRRFAGGDGDVDALSPWAQAHLETLADVEAGWEQAAAGDTLLHSDLRVDNILVDDHGVVTFVDWPWACTGASFVDLVMFLPSVGLGGGPDPADVAERHGLFADVDGDAVAAVLAGVAGFLARSAQDPPPPGLPRLRAFQQAQADVAVAWLRRLLA